ncbi:MAG: DUF3089 domain-containing protein [Thermoflexibacter sp.]|nr:DUF3089 domain-containing protein [Thermoflexibacter sp.]
MKSIFFTLSQLLLMIVVLQSCVTLRNKPIMLQERFDTAPVPSAPDYSNPDHWAALPDKQDNADLVPFQSDLKEGQQNAKADVFFIYPTVYTYKPTRANSWNADVNDSELNKKIDESTIQNQASIFNESGKIYAPRYRQAHIYAYFTPNKEDAKKAFEIAYQDVKTAFEYYLKYYNQGKPIIIAAHSQGTQHATRLLQEFFDGKPLANQLVVAYLVGMPTLASYFQVLKPCESPSQTGCYNTWNTYAKNYFPPKYEEKLKYAVSVNPLTWKTDEEYATKELHKGGVAWGFKLTKPNAVDAQNHQGMLWINKPNIKGKAFLRVKNWHVADYNLFYMNVRENVKIRTEAFIQQWAQKTGK